MVYQLHGCLCLLRRREPGFILYPVCIMGSFVILDNPWLIQSMLLGCPLPCTETLVKTVFMNEFHKTSSTMNVSRVDIAFYNKVDTTVRDFPTFNLSSLLASLGGALGLWLGLGMLQILDSILPTTCRDIQYCKRVNRCDCISVH